MYDEGKLRAYVDGELESEPRLAVETHLDGCAECRARVTELGDQAEWIGARMAGLAPAGTQPMPSPSAALSRFRQRASASAGENWGWAATSIFGRLDRMVKQGFSGRWKPALVGLVALVLVGGALTLPPVRSAAADFLGIFRVRKFAALSLNPAQVQNLERSLKSVDGMVFGEPEMLREPGPKQDVGSAAEAGALANFTVRLPAQVPASAGEPKLTYQSGSAARFRVDAAKIRTLLDAAGRPDLQVPAAVDGAVVEVDVPGIVEAQYNGLDLIQAPSPTVTLPPGVDLAQLANVGLQAIGMTREEAEQVSKSIDWANTLVIPVPTEMGSFRQVDVDGTTGLLISSRSASAGRQTLLWEKDDVVYGLSGSGDGLALLEAANSMR